MIELITYLIPSIISAIILFRLRYKKDPFIRIEWQALSGFLAFMAMATMFRFCYADLIISLWPELKHTFLDNPNANRNIFTLLLVWWEDVFFVLPIAAIIKRNPSKWISVPLITLLTLVFANAHMYQGIMGFVFAGCYPLIAYTYAKKYGLGTVMLAHMLYDFVTVMTVKSMAFLL